MATARQCTKVMGSFRVHLGYWLLARRPTRKNGGAGIDAMTLRYISDVLLAKLLKTI